MGRGRARHVEGRFHRGLIFRGKSTADRYIKDKFEIEINGVEGRQVSKAIERLLVPTFNCFNERDDFVDRPFIQNPAGTPEDK